MWGITESGGGVNTWAEPTWALGDTRSEGVMEKVSVQERAWHICKLQDALGVCLTGGERSRRQVGELGRGRISQHLEGKANKCPFCSNSDEKSLEGFEQGIH